MWVSLGFPGSSVVKNSSAYAGPQVQLLSLEHSLEEEMATQSSILAWNIPWIEEPGRMRSIGLEGFGHRWVTEHTHTHTYIYIYIYIFFFFNSLGFSSLDACFLSQISKVFQSFFHVRFLPLSLSLLLLGVLYHII